LAIDHKTWVNPFFNTPTFEAPPVESRRVMNHAIGELVEVGNREPEAFRKAREQREAAEVEAERILGSAAPDSPPIDDYNPPPIVEKVFAPPTGSVEPEFDPNFDDTPPADRFNPGDYKIEFGRDKGKTLIEVGPSSVQNTLKWIQQECVKPNKTLAPSLQRFVEFGRQFMAVSK